ncbi:MAG: hypothetical protein KBD83_03800, partial [Gammaproteobacteria bacterium]|nr:hypothetical protein [Gammaproteobacteria bacterium]
CLHKRNSQDWVPACAGMTLSLLFVQSTSQIRVNFDHKMSTDPNSLFILQSKSFGNSGVNASIPKGITHQEPIKVEGHS